MAMLLSEWNRYDNKLCQCRQFFFRSRKTPIVFIFPNSRYIVYRFVWTTPSRSTSKSRSLNCRFIVYPDFSKKYWLGGYPLISSAIPWVYFFRKKSPIVFIFPNSRYIVYQFLWTTPSRSTGKSRRLKVPFIVDLDSYYGKFIIIMTTLP